MDGFLDPGTVNPARSETSFHFLRPEDDAEVRRLLHAAPLAGSLRLRLTQEPSYLGATALGGAEETLLVARQAGRVVALGRCTVQDRFIDGRPQRCGYLCQLRLASDAVRRGALVRDGFRAFAQALSERPAALYFTSILDDNTRARTVLERPGPGRPLYTRAGGYSTFVLNVPAPNAAHRLRLRAEAALARAGLRITPGTAVTPAGLTAALNGLAREHPLALVWSENLLARLARHGLEPRDFLLLHRGNQCVAACALWDQRAFRQIVVDGYAPPLDLLRHAYNIFSFLRRRPLLPAPGGSLRLAYLSPLLCRRDAFETLPPLADLARALAATRGLHYLVLGHGAGEPAWDRAFAALRARRTGSTLHRVTWAGDTGSSTVASPAPPWHPEVALL